MDCLSETEALTRVLGPDEIKTHSTSACLSCGKKLNRWSGWKISDNESMIRCSCGAYVDSVIVGLNILRSNQKWIDRANVPGSTWYHSTRVENWFDGITDVTGPSWVHIGTSFSAKARGKHAGTHKYMHKVKIKDDARVSPEIFIDHNEWNGVARVAIDYDVVRYINRWESVGSISLMARPHALTLA